MSNWQIQELCDFFNSQQCIQPEIYDLGREGCYLEPLGPLLARRIEKGEKNQLEQQVYIEALYTLLKKR